jgi:hypothetical protein
MQVCRTAAAVTLLVACGALFAGPAAADAASPAQRAMVGKVNAVRAAHGLKALRGAAPSLRPPLRGLDAAA